MTTPTIKQLRQSGWKVKVMHTRNHKQVQKMGGMYAEVDNNGGQTVIEVTSPEGLSGRGIAVCSLQDNFNHRVGNCVALGRALQDVHAIP